MLDIDAQRAVKAVLVDLAEGSRVSSAHIENLLGISAEKLAKVVADFPCVESVDLEILDLAVHNGLNLYLNGIEISDADWTEKLGTTQADVERAFEQWQRKI